MLDLPTDFRRPPVQTAAGASQSLRLPQSLAAAVDALSQREGTTLFITLFATFLTLLHRYTGQVDLVVGTPIANRNRSEVEPLIGFFVNALVLRTSLVGNPPFRELLGRVRETALGAYAHQDYPFEKLVEQMAPERRLSHMPLFQVMFNLLQESAGPSELSDMAAGTGDEGERTIPTPEWAKFDLSLYARQSADGLRLELVYRTDLFQAATGAGLLRHFRALLEDIVADPDRPISQLGLDHQPRLEATGWTSGHDSTIAGLQRVPPDRDRGFDRRMLPPPRPDEPGSCSDTYGYRDVDLRRARPPCNRGGARARCRVWFVARTRGAAL